MSDLSKHCLQVEDGLAGGPTPALIDMPVVGAEAIKGSEAGVLAGIYGHSAIPPAQPISNGLVLTSRGPETLAALPVAELHQLQPPVISAAQTAADTSALQTATTAQLSAVSLERATFDGPNKDGASEGSVAAAARRAASFELGQMAHAGAESGLHEGGLGAHRAALDSLNALRRERREALAEAAAALLAAEAALREAEEKVVAEGA